MIVTTTVGDVMCSGQPWKAKINTKQVEVDVATIERNVLAQKAEDLKKQLEEAQEAYETLKTDQQVKISDQEVLKNKKANLQKELRQAEERLKRAQERVQECRQKASSSRQKVHEAKTSQADSRSQNRVLDSLTRLQASRRIQGFYGRLGSLGTVPDKYDSTKGKLVSSTSISRASFIVLEKLSNMHTMEPIQTPENVPRLFDFIKPKDPRFASAFYKGRRWRVVMLAGQLIDTSGTMSGGGSQPARGGMSSKLLTKELDRAVQEVREAEVERDRLAGLGPTFDML
ncbi:hypothetical protein AX14_002213 [Amanita brunnescens Koide BX004]|nr:hypothetical protein AX14_002213 [Amanita brunnescens Koide BX004]